MTFETLNVILAQAGQVEDQRAATIKSFGLMAVLLVVMYVVLLRPQQKKAKEQAKMLTTIKAGDKVITSSGIVGIVINVKDKTLSIRSMDAKLEITKGAVVEITDRGGDTSAA